MYIKRICWTITIVIMLLFVTTNVHSIVERAYSTANRDAAIAAVNGGEAEFTNVQTIKSVGNTIDGLFYLFYISILAWGGVRIYRTMMVKSVVE